MPKVAQYGGPQVLTQVSNQPRANAAAGSAVFDANIRTAGSAVELAQEVVAVKQRVDTTSAEEALVGFERDKNDLFFNADTGYFNSQGKNAYDGATGANESMQELRKQYGASLNSNSKSMFDKAAAAHITRSQADIARHASKGLKAWEVATIEAQVENTVENASLYWNQPDKLAVQNALGREAILDSAELTGIGAEATNEKLQTFDSSFARSAVEAAIGSSAANGAAMLDKMGKRLEGPDKVKLEKAVAAKVKTEKIQADSAFAVSTAVALVDKYDKKSDAMQEIESLADSDPDKYKSTRAEINAQFALKKQAEKQEEVDSYHRAIGLVNTGDLTIEQIKAADPTAWDGMDDIQRNNILSGKHRLTDQVLLTTLRSLPKKEKAELDPNDYASQLKPSDLSKLVTEVNNAKKGQPLSRVETLAKKSLDAAQNVFGAKEKWRFTGNKKLTGRGKLANQFIDDVQAAIQDFEEVRGGKITPVEENKMIAEMTRDFYVKRTAFGFDFLAGDIDLNPVNTPREDIKLLNTIADKLFEEEDADNRTKLARAYQAVVDAGSPVTPANIQAEFYRE